MRIYISGKITGLSKSEAWYNFGQANRKLHSKGHDVVDPISIGEHIPGLDWKSYMTIAYGIIHDPSVNAIYMLKNWPDSPGAVIEWSWAQARGLPVLYEDPAHYEKYERRMQ